MARTLTAAETEHVKRLMAQGRMPTPDDLVAAEMTADERTFADPATAAVAGGEYRLGDLRLRNVAGHFLLLYEMDSPLVQPDAKEMTMVDVAIALYILAEGRRAVQPIMDVQCRQRACEQARALAASDPKLFAVYLDKLAECHAARAEFEQAAIAFYGAHVPPESGVQDVYQFMVNVLNDTFEAAALLGTGAEKKTAPAPSTSNGSRASKPPSRLSALATRARKCFGRFRSAISTG